MNKVAINGVLQLLGFHLCNECLNKGIEVIGFDNFKRNKPIKEEMLMEIGRNANFQFVETNDKPDNLKPYLQDVTMFFYLNNENEDISNIKEIVDICDELHLPIVTVSSLEVYGNCDRICNEDSPLHPLTKYGKRKKLEEQYWLKDAEINDRQIAIFRLPNLFGPWQDPEDSFHQLVYQFVKNNVSLHTIINNSSLSRDYMFVSNVVDALLLVMNHRFSCEIYNLSLNEKKYCTKKIRNEFSYKPKYTYQHGVEILIKHMLKMLKRNPSLYEQDF